MVIENIYYGIENRTDRNIGGKQQEEFDERMNGRKKEIKKQAKNKLQTFLRRQ